MLDEPRRRTAAAAVALHLFSAGQRELPSLRVTGLVRRARRLAHRRPPQARHSILPFLSQRARARLVGDDGTCSDAGTWQLSEDPDDKRDGLWIWGLFEEPLYPFLLVSLDSERIGLPEGGRLALRLGHKSRPNEGEQLLSSGSVAARRKNSASFGFEPGQPHSMKSMPNSASRAAIFSLSSTEHEMDSPCVPSRSVVSKRSTSRSVFRTKTSFEGRSRGVARVVGGLGSVNECARDAHRATATSGAIAKACPADRRQCTATRHRPQSIR